MFDFILALIQAILIFLILSLWVMLAVIPGIYHLVKLVL